MKRKLFTVAMGLMAAAACVALVAGALQWRGLQTATASAASSTAPASAPVAAPAQVAPAQGRAVNFTGSYAGPIKLNVTVAGVYSDTLAVPPADPSAPDLGSIDLALVLTQTGNALVGYVDLGQTLVYSVAHTVGTGATAIQTGPFVTGSFDGTNVVVESEQVGLVVSGKPVQRQFRLVGAISSPDGGQMKGEYRETLWGYTVAPVTVIGAFTLQRPGFGSSVAVTGANAPTAVADTATTAPGKSVTINVLANDVSATGGSLKITSVSKPQFGTATTNGQTVTYTANRNFVGTDSFTYFVADANGNTSAGSVTVTVSGTITLDLYLPLIRH